MGYQGGTPLNGLSELKNATNMVANVTKTFNLVTKNFSLVATLAAMFPDTYM